MDIITFDKSSFVNWLSPEKDRGVFEIFERDLSHTYTPFLLIMKIFPLSNEVLTGLVNSKLGCIRGIEELDTV